MSGAGIAAEVLAALTEAGQETGAGPLLCTIKRPASGGSEPTTPWDAEDTPASAPTLYQVTGIQDTKQIRDMAGMLTGETMTTITIDATGVEPLKSDLIAVGVAMADADGDTVYHEIADIEPLAPGGVALLYEVKLAG